MQFSNKFVQNLCLPYGAPVLENCTLRYQILQMQVLEIRAEPLTQANFADYGQVVEVPEDSVQSMSANQGIN